MGKKIYTTIFALLIGFTAFAQSPNVGIGTSKPDAKAILDIFSTEKGLLIPRLTEQERNNLQANASPNPSAAGLLIYNTTSDKFNFWDGNNWQEVGFSGATNTSIKWFDGTYVPTPTNEPSRKDGDYYVNNTTGKIYRRTTGTWTDMNITAPEGAQGPQGITGPKGDTGTTWFSGTGAPTNTSVLGARDDDYYLETNTGDIYQKTTSGWNNPILNIKGTMGLTGAMGATGTTGAQGDTGTIWFNGAGTPTTNSVPDARDDDYYLNTNTGDVYQKTPTRWNPILNIKGASGAPGAAGADGARGSIWHYGSGVPTPANPNTHALNDYYLDTSNGDIYQETTTGWNRPILNIKGPAGTGTTSNKWYNGPSFPPPSNISPVGGDYYLNNQTKDIYKYDGGTNSWAPTNVNIMGPAGAAGATGAPGSSGRAFKYITTTPYVSLDTYPRIELINFRIDPTLNVRPGDVVYASVDGNLPNNIFIMACWVSNNDEVTVKFSNNVTFTAEYILANTTIIFGFIKQ